MKNCRLIFLIILVSTSCKREFKGDGDVNSYRFTHDGIKRSYKVYLPENYISSKTYPLVLALHGRYGNARNTPKMTIFNPLADELDFIVVYPNGYKRSWNDGRGEGPAAEDNIDDVGFISKLIDEVAANYPINEDKIYVTGMSNGGFMTMRLACELSNKIAAFGSVTGSISQDFESWCTPNQSVPVMLIAGVEDSLVPYDGGEVAESGTYSIGFEYLHDFFGEHNNCTNLSKEIISVKYDDGTDVEKWIFNSCDENKEVILFKINGGGHTWPSGGPYLNENTVGKLSKEIDASRELVNFFFQYSLN